MVLKKYPEKQHCLETILHCYFMCPQNILQAKAPVPFSLDYLFKDGHTMIVTSLVGERECLATEWSAGYCSE